MAVWGVSGGRVCAESAVTGITAAAGGEGGGAGGGGGWGCRQLLKAQQEVFSCRLALQFGGGFTARARGRGRARARARALGLGL